MLLEQERIDIVNYGKKMLHSGLTKGTAGNLSIYNAKEKCMAISPSGIDYEKIEPSDIVVMDLEGNSIDGKRKPSSEHYLHRMIYKKRSDVQSIVHTHSMYCVVLACLGIPIKSVHYVLADTKSFEIPVAPYFTYGTEELAKSVVETLGSRNAVLMANHGMVSCGSQLSEAYSIASTCEWVAEIQCRCLTIGKPNYLTEDQMNVVLEKFKNYGQNNLNGAYFSEGE